MNKIINGIYRKIGAFLLQFFDLYKYNNSGGKEKSIKHPLYFILHDEPNPEMTSFVFRETLMTHLLLWGNAYAQIIRNSKGEVTAIYPLMPNRMTVDRDDKGQLIYRYNTGKDEAPTMTRKLECKGYKRQWTKCQKRCWHWLWNHYSTCLQYSDCNYKRM